jgi:ABC-type multidrug transport system fused ATPase/permease subunit
VQLEDQWIQRTLDARKKELKWLVRSRLNSIIFNALWTATPILVSIVSFSTFVALANALNVSTAFTAIILFDMIRQPLNVIPTSIVQILQTTVAVNRIAAFLDEHEVSAQVSSLKQFDRNTSEEGLRLERASFRWNLAKKGSEPKTKPGEAPLPSTAPQRPASAANSIDSSQTFVADEIRNTILANPDFELCDLNVQFPEGVLTVVTGPTASGKSALLVRSMVIKYLSLIRPYGAPS